MANDRTRTVVFGLYRAYALALALIIATLLISQISVSRILHAADADATLINESGRQRLLSQRMLYFATAYSGTGDDALRDELVESTDRFELNQDVLGELAQHDPSLQKLYFDGNTSLDAMARRYISDARSVATGQGDLAAALQRMRRDGPSPLLDALDRAVSGWQARADRRANRLENWNRLSLFGTIAVLFMVALAVLWPTVRFVRSVLRDVDEARAELSSSLVRLERFASVGTDLLWQTDFEGNITFLEGRFVERGLVDKRSVMGAPHASIIHLDDSESQRMWESIEALQPYRGIRGRYEDTAGEAHVLELSGAPLFGPDGKVTGYYGAAQDITDRVERDAQYRMLANHATDVIVTFGPDRVIRYASPSVAKFGRSPEELVGKRTLDFIHPDDIPILAEMNRDLFSGDAPDTSVPREFRAFKGDGSIVWLEGQPNVVRGPDGEAELAISSYRDVTLRKQREAELEEARQLAESAVKAKADFLSNMSHEIRTPLNGVLGFTQILAGTELDADQAGCVDRINRAGRTLLEIVNDILDYSKIEAGKMTLEPGIVDLNTVVKETVDLVQAARPNRFVSYDVACPEDEPIIMEGDEVRLRQIVTNLVANAAKFTENGTISVITQLSGDRVLITVEDTGVGIPTDKLEKIFESFSQSDGSITRRFGGTGLGLSITRSLVDMMSGDIQIESAVGLGTKIEIDLPYRAAELPRDTVEDGPAPKATRQSDLGIIVIDDVETNRALIRMHLSRLGYEVACFASAEDAIDWLQDGIDFDLILMDVQMPEMDGLTATRIIRELPEPICDIPIVALTANAMADEIEACFEAGMDGYLAKPVDLDALVRKIEQVARGKRPLGAGAPVPQRAAVDMADTAETADPEYEALLEDCIAFISEAQQSVRDILVNGSEPGQLENLLATAHRVAGTVGFFGFEALSDAAFRLEAAARAALDGRPDASALAEAVAAFDTEAGQAAA